MNDHLFDVPEFDRLADYFGPWAIESRAAAGLLDLVSRMDLAAHVAEGLQARSEPRSTVEMVQAANGKTVAVLRAAGVLMKGQSSLGRSTSTVQLRRDLRAAANNPDVSAILLHIDSPGGSVAGTEALATDIREARRTKPVYGQIEDMGASAAYWLASQCDKVFAETESTLVGDIGTYGYVTDSSEAASKAGLKTVMFKSGSLKGIGTPGSQITAEQQQYMQDMAEKSQQPFTNDVRRARNLNEQQLATVTRGGAYIAKEAQAHGLIDGVQSTAATLAALSSLGVPGRQTAGMAASNKTVPVPTSRTGESLMNQTFAEFLTARGLVAENLAETTVKALTADWEALKARSGPDDDDGDDDTVQPSGVRATIEHHVGGSLAESRKAAAAELRRQAEIQKLCAGHPGIAADAIEQGWEPLKAENAVLKASQRVQSGPHLQMGSTSRDVTNEILMAALCLSGKLREPEKHFKAETLDRADQHCRGWGLQRVLLHFAQKNGWSGDYASAFRLGNVGGLLRAAFSSTELSNTLGGSAQRFARQGIRGKISQTWRMLSSIVTVNDFRPTDGLSIIEGNTYEEIGPMGEIPHGTLSESTWTNRARSFAKMLAIPFQHIRNDSLGFLSSADKLLGRGAARAIRKEWFTEFMDNSSFFTSGNGNYASGSGTALSSTSLGTAEALFRAQTTADGDEVDFDPAFLLVPTALDPTARELFTTTTWNTGGASSSDRIASENIFNGLYEPLTDSLLSNSNYTGYSTKAWYLLADPADAPVMEVCFLDGREDPTIETAEVDFHQLGIQMRGHIHFGVKLAEYRAGVKMKGEA